MVPRRYALNIEKWEEHGNPIDFEKLVIHKKYNKFHGQETHRKVEGIGETLAFQGSCWVMRKELFNELNLLDENPFGKFGHESVEISFKVWQNGGKVLVNTDTWYAHPVSAKRTHNTPNNYKMWKKVREMYNDDYTKYVLNHALY
jgi:GT2 family glycosyltransferase